PGRVPNALCGLITAGPLAARTVARGQLLRPFPQFNGVTQASIANRDSIYHSMQLKVERRFRAGGSLLGSYTWAKFITNTDTLTGWLEASGPGGVQNNYDLRNERSLASFDAPHRLVISYVLDLPFGRGQKLLGSLSGPADKMISGWGGHGGFAAQR